MYQTSYLEDYIERLYRNLGIHHPEQLDKYAIGNELNVGIYLVSGESEAFCSSKRNYIFLNGNLNHKERWQDFGHELCHVLRHAGHQNKMQPMFRDLQEWQADNFAYHFCVPTFMLKRIRLPTDRSRAICLIAETFGVEYSFAEKRLDRYLNKLYAAVGY